jgi:hypothetical protein
MDSKLLHRNNVGIIDMHALVLYIEPIKRDG